ncbi:unnamed protein product [Nippostrongylus brasiliensis]|uniref:DBR1 domain-containing protein n=1 Tax=Nippostrongylus brasiliensis TaxID=27835 RepID=A0A0N4YL30_NIPBR|nr:unnamed protein product [Nippostrongylus brasiliensis]
MNSSPAYDSVTLKGLNPKSRDSKLLLNLGRERLVTQPIPPSDVLKRLSSFIPKIAEANELLTRDEINETSKLDVDIHKVDPDQDDSEETSSSDEGSSSEDSDDETDACPKVQFDVSLFREGESSSKREKETIIPQEVESVPEGFREDEKSDVDIPIKEKRRKLVEEM